MNRPRSTLFRRLVIGITLVGALAIASAAAFLYLRYGAVNDRFREGTLESFASTLMRKPGAQIELRRSVERQILEEGGRFVVLSATGEVLAASDGVTGPLIPYEATRNTYFQLSGQASSVPLYGLSLRLERTPPIYVQLAFPINDVIFDSILEEFVLDIGLLWLPFLATVLLTVVLVARFALRPLLKAAEQAGEIGPNSVGVRLSEQDLPTDVLALVRAVNSALDRMQAGYQTLETFVGDVAHELRTPLAVVKTRLAISKEPLAREIAEDVAPMERLVEQLLDRVRLGRLHYEPDDVVDLAAVAIEVGSFFALQAVAKRRAIAVEGAERPVPVNGARDFIFRALRNLVENALAHAPPGSVVTVSVGPERTISVRDRGPGFPLEKLDPQSRETSRGRSLREDGVGLGLSIVDRTMAAHGGALELANPADGGARAMMSFPAPDPDGAGTQDVGETPRFARATRPDTPIASRT